MGNANYAVTRAELNGIYKQLEQGRIERVAQTVQIIMLNHRLLMEKTDRLIFQVRNEKNRLAVEFVNSQVMLSIAQVTFVSGALMMANNEYNSILGLKDSQRSISLGLLSIALIAIPGLGPIAVGIKAWGDNSSKIKNFAAHVGNNINDFFGAGTSMQKNEADNVGMNNTNSSNGVIRDALEVGYKQIEQALSVQNLIPRIINNGLSDTQLKSNWVSAGLPILSSTQSKAMRDVGNLELLAKIYLYDMLRAYTGQWVKYELDATESVNTNKLFGGGFLQESAKDSQRHFLQNLPEDGNRYGDFTGMTQAARDAIYARFGTHSASIFSAKTSRPMITGYRDMVKHWGLKVS